MNKNINISEKIYVRLELHAKGFNVAPEKVIETLLDYYEKNQNLFPSEVHHIAEINDQVIKFTPKELKGNILAYTKVVDGQFGNEKIKSWKDLEYLANKYAFLKFNEDFDALKKISQSNLKKGDRSKKENGEPSGFCFYEDIKLSIQGQNSTVCWKHALNLAQHINLPFWVKIEWLKKSQQVNILESSDNFYSSN